MPFHLITTAYYDRRLKKFRRAHPELRATVEAIYRNLALDPFQPQLRLHSLAGGMDGLYAVRLTHSYRIVLTLLIEKDEITLLDIGSHDEVYR